MPLFRRPSGPPVRPPDPEPHIEARLQQVDELEHQIRRKQAQIAGYQAEITTLQTEARRFARRTASSWIEAFGSPESNDEQRGQAERRVTALHQLIRELEEDIRELRQGITQLHDDIAAERYKYLR